MTEINDYALKGIRAEIERLQALEKQLTGKRGKAPKIHIGVKLGGVPQEMIDAVNQPKKRKLSAAGRKAISDAAKKRWAKVKAKKG